MDRVFVAGAGGVGVVAEESSVNLALAGKPDEFDLASEQTCAAGGDDAAADIDLNELVAQVGLACLEQLLAKGDIAFADTYRIAFEEADIMRLVSVCDQREEVELGEELSASGTEGLLVCDLNTCKVRERVIHCAVRIELDEAGKRVALLLPPSRFSCPLKCCPVAPMAVRSV